MLKNRPPRHKAFLTLEISIASYKGSTGPGKWVVDSAQSFIALSWICESEQIPPDFDGVIPWTVYGGDTILRNAGLWGNRFVAGKNLTTTFPQLSFQFENQSGKLTNRNQNSQRTVHRG